MPSYYLLLAESELPLLLPPLWGVLTCVILLLLAAVCVCFSAARSMAAQLKALERTLNAVRDHGFERLPMTGRAPVDSFLCEVNRTLARLTVHISDVESENTQLQSMLNAMLEPVLVIRPDGRIRLVNPAAADLFGFTQAVQDRSFFEEIRHTELHRTFEKLLKDTEQCAVNERIRFQLNPGDAVRILSLNGSQIRDRHHVLRGVLMVFDDVTQRQLLEEKQREFVANVSHEIRTPLTVIKGVSELLLESEAECPENLRPFIQSLHAQTARLISLSEDLLSLARFEAEEPLNYDAAMRDNVDCAALCCKVLSLSAYEADAKSIVCSYEGPDSLFFPLKESAVEQLLTNLICNAIRYSPPGKSVRLTLSGDAQRGVVFTVQDDGVGIAPEALSRLFERFYRADKSRSRACGGTGLGLAIAARIARLHNGTISVSSTLGKGSVFTVRIPPI